MAQGQPRASELLCQGLDSESSEALEFLVISCSVFGGDLRPDLNQPGKFEQCSFLWVGDRLDQSLGL